MNKNTKFIGLALFFAVLSLFCLGAALPDIDAALPASERQIFGVTFAFFGASAVICFHRAKAIAAQRTVVEALLVFAALLFVGLFFNA